jgi:hypothetical protein
MLHYRCDNGFVFDGQYSACTAGLSSPSCLQLQQAAGHNFVANDEAATGWAVTDIPLLATSNNKTTSPSQATLNRSPIKILPQIWQMAGQDSGSSGSAPLVCTTQRIYRLQTCGYYYSCIEKEKGKFHLQEVRRSSTRLLLLCISGSLLFKFVLSTSNIKAFKILS